MSVNSSELLNLRNASGSSDATMTKEGRSRSYERDVPLPNDCRQIYGTLEHGRRFFQALHRAMNYLYYAIRSIQISNEYVYMYIFV